MSVEYPTEQEVNEGGFFPVREPGDFPSTGPPITLLHSSSVSEVSKRPESVEEDAYDPLRDGPLRYLGYANELGYCILTLLKQDLCLERLLLHGCLLEGFLFLMQWPLLMYCLTQGIRD